MESGAWISVSQASLPSAELNERADVHMSPDFLGTSVDHDAPALLVTHAITSCSTYILNDHYAYTPIDSNAMVTAATAHDVPAPPPLERLYSAGSGSYRVFWQVPARDLAGDGHRLLSPSFQFSFGTKLPNVSFKLMLFASGARSFKKAKGRGYFELKCESAIPAFASARLTFLISVGNQPARGPVDHDFSSRACCGLPKKQEVWSLSSVVNPQTNTCPVCLEVSAGPLPLECEIPSAGLQSSTSGNITLVNVSECQFGNGVDLGVSATLPLIE